MFVVCQACGEKHRPGEVEVTDVEEDYTGADVITFTCPERNLEVKCRVYRDANG